MTLHSKESLNIPKG